MSPSKKPILHIHEEDELINGLRDTIVQERELESGKVSLCLKPDFNLNDAFNIFDVANLANITACEMREGLNAIGVFPTLDEVDLFVKRYDLNNDGRLSFGEFSKAFESSDHYYAGMLARRPSNHRHVCVRRDDCFYAGTQSEFRNMWRVHFKCETGAE
jgi:hypothetical protein